MSKKTEDIKVRVEPIKKLALQQIAQREQLDLSDIVRRAISDFLQKAPTSEQGRVYGDA